MEAGRNKGNKNRIEYNDPLMLINLAEAYYRTMQFSEALEIYFAMSTQFPASVRYRWPCRGCIPWSRRVLGTQGSSDWTDFHGKRPLKVFTH